MKALSVMLPKSPFQDKERVEMWNLGLAAVCTAVQNDVMLGCSLSF